jgi:hypothetical protein
MTSTYLTRPQAIDPATVKGWAVDADPRNDPTYPYRLRGGDSGPAEAWDRPTQQRPDVEVLRSIEHNRLPAVVGTSTPPSGLSGHDAPSRVPLQRVRLDPLAHALGR